MGQFDRPAAGRTRSGGPRFIGLDVARAIALIGVVTMNYHGMLNFSGWSSVPTSLVDRIFDIGTGVLSTRFAATFVVVAGVGITLMTNSSRTSAVRGELIDTRVRLLRRGCALMIGGYFLDLTWPGTILFYYGAYFILMACLFHVRTRTLIALAISTVLGTLAVSIWIRHRHLEGHSTSWISPSDIESPQDFLARTFLGYTHPVLPWFTFLLAGVILGRHLEDLRTRWRSLCAALTAAIASSYVLATLVRSFDVEESAWAYVMSSMQPDERGLAYIVSTLCIGLVAVVLVSVVADRFSSARAVTALQRAGQLSLTLYLGHVGFYYAVAEWSGWDIGSGLGSALALAGVYWLLAITIGSWWHHRIGTGPAERLYRWIGG